MLSASIVLSVILAAAFLLSGGRKLAGSPAVAAEATHLRIPVAGYRGIGSLEIAGAVGLLAGLAWMPLGAAAATGFVLLMAGAVITHRRVADPVAKWAPSLVLAILAIATLAMRVAAA